MLPALSDKIVLRTRMFLCITISPRVSLSSTFKNQIESRFLVVLFLSSFIEVTSWLKICTHSIFWSIIFSFSTTNWNQNNNCNILYLNAYVVNHDLYEFSIKKKKNTKTKYWDKIIQKGRNHLTKCFEKKITFCCNLSFFSNFLYFIFI